LDSGPIRSRGRWAIITAMSNAAAVNRVLLVHDTPARVTGREAKVLRRYRLARVSLSGRTPAARRPIVTRARG
jgi:hypothetical protein